MSSTTAGAGGEAFFEDDEACIIETETRVWGCADCGNKEFLVLDGTPSTCLRCAGVAVSGDGSAGAPTTAAAR
jgi:hypothetical protein